MTADALVHTGSCHCGTVTFEVRGPITRATRCTCSICSRVGAVWHATSEQGLTILSGEDALSLYQFGTMTARHYFCPHCGVHPFTRPRLDPTMWAVNLRCVSGVEADLLPTSVFDGANWEAAAEALRARARSRGSA
jgi:hypothetical protein